MRIITGAVLLLLLIPGLVAEEEEDDAHPDDIIATEWAVRQTIEELFADLAAGRQSRPRLFDRTIALLRKDGNKIYRYGGVYLCVREAILRHLEQQGMAEAFFDYAEPLARHRLEQVLRTADEAELRQVATQFPGTDSARRAWQHLADLAWDHGHLDRYINYAEHAEEHTDAERSRRLAIAMRLIAPRQRIDLPEHIHKAHPMWHLDLMRSRGEHADPDSPEARMLLQHSRNAGNQQPVLPMRFALDPKHNLLAVVADHSLTLVDPVVGRSVFGPHAINRQQNTSLGLGAGNDGSFAVISKQYSNQADLHMVNGLARKVRTFRIELQNNSAVSDPVLTDRHVVFAELVNSREGAQLKLHAHRRSDGKQAWSTLIGQSSSGHRYHHHMPRQQPPLVRKHLGRFAVISNTGIMSVLDTDGNIKKIWPYRSFGTPIGLMQQNHYNNQVELRSGEIAADGRHIVFAPADSTRQLIYDCLEDRLKVYDGPDCEGSLLGCHAGRALIADDHLRAVDLASGDSLWENDLRTYQAPVWSSLDARHLLLAQGHFLSQYALNDGRHINTRDLTAQTDLTVLNGILLVGNDQRLVGYGDSEALATQYRELAAVRPEAYEPLLALATIAEKNDEPHAALGLLLQALERGCPRERTAEAMAIWRRGLALRIGDEDFDAEVERITPFLRYEQGFASEITWWRARHQEALGNPAAAHRLYEKVLEDAPRLVAFPDGARIQTHQLALAGLHRLGDPRRPLWRSTPASPAETEEPIAPPDGTDAAATQPVEEQPAEEPPVEEPPAEGGWQQTALHYLGQPLIHTSKLISFANGNLIAQNIETGEIVWERAPSRNIRPLLGVKFSSERGVRITVLPGTSAQRVGLQDKDLITHFNDTEIATRSDLIREIAKLDFQDEFTVRVDRDGNDLLFAGTIGSQLIQPVSANDRYLITQKTTAIAGDHPFVKPETMRAPAIDVYSTSDGTHLWKRPLQATRPEHLLAPPVLSAEHHLLLVDGDDIVAYDISPVDTDEGSGFPDSPKKLWSLEGAAPSFADLELLSSEVAVYADRHLLQLRFVDLDEGEILAEIPCNPAHPHLLNDEQLIVRRFDGRLTAWNLELGEALWTSDRWGLTPIAWAADGIFARNIRHQLVLLDRTNGKRRRFYPQWSDLSDSVTVEDHLVFHSRLDGDRSHLVAIGLGSGTVTWKRLLPLGLEVQDGLLVADDAIAVRLQSLHRNPSVMLLDAADGELRQGRVMQPGETVLTHEGDLLFIGPHGIRRVQEQSLAPAPPLAARPFRAESDDPRRLLQEDLDDLAWQQLTDDAAYAVARHDDNLLLFVRLTTSASTVDIHLGDRGGDGDRPSTYLRFAHGGTPEFRNDRQSEGWRYLKVGLRKEDGLHYYCALLAPPVLRSPTAVLRLHAECETRTGGPDVPWWVRSAWREITGLHPGSTEKPSPEMMKGTMTAIDRMARGQHSNAEDDDVDEDDEDDE